MATPTFSASLLSSLVPEIAGAPTATFARATNGYVRGVAPAGNAVDGEILVFCVPNEARFWGARRVSQGVWSSLYADGSPIPANKLLGYFSENTATNLILRSREFDNSVWNPNNVQVSPNAVIGPDGLQQAYTITDTATNSTHNFVQNVSPGGTTPWYTIHAKAGTLQWLQLFAGGGPQAKRANFNLTAGALGFVDPQTTAAIWPLPNGWYRCGIQVTGNSNVQLFLSQADVGAPPSYPGGTGTLHLWGAQVEATEPTSYIPTTTGTSIRDHDWLDYAVVGNVGNAVGSSYTEQYMPIAAVGQYHIMLRWLANNTSPNYYEAATKKASFYAGTGLSVANVRVIGAISKVASGWSGSTASVVADGGVVATGSQASLPFPNSGVLRIGNGEGAYAMQGTIRNVRLYNVRLSDAELLAMTGAAGASAVKTIGGVPIAAVKTRGGVPVSAIKSVGGVPFQ
jgi:hypothetical protein